MWTVGLVSFTPNNQFNVEAGGAGEAGGDWRVTPRQGRTRTVVITACQPDMLVTSLHQTFYIPLVIIHRLHPLSRLARRVGCQLGKKK